MRDKNDSSVWSWFQAALLIFVDNRTRPWWIVEYAFRLTT